MAQKHLAGRVRRNMSVKIASEVFLDSCHHQVPIRASPHRRRTAELNAAKAGKLKSRLPESSGAVRGRITSSANHSRKQKVKPAPP